jgi:hypothetical protein
LLAHASPQRKRAPLAGRPLNPAKLPEKALLLAFAFVGALLLLLLDSSAQNVAQRGTRIG